MSEDQITLDEIRQDNSKTAQGRRLVRVGPREIELPKDWDIQRLDPSSGITRRVTDGSHHSPDQSDDGEYYYATVSNLSSNGIYYDSCGLISESEYEKMVKGDCKPRNGEVLFSKDGTVGITTVFDDDKDVVLLSSIAMIDPVSEHLNASYLSQFLSSWFTEFQIQSLKSGTAIRRVVLVDIEKIEIPLPSVSEQRKIATVLYNVDQAIQKTEEILEKRRKIRKGTVQSLLTQGIDHSEYRKSRIGPKKVTIPSEWDIKRISEIAEIKNGNRIIPGHEYAEDQTEYPFIRISDMEDGNIATENIKYLKEETASQMNRGIISSDEVYITVTGRVGDAGTVPEELDGAHFTDNAAKLYDFEGVTNEYLSLYLRSKFGQDEVHRFTVGSNQPKLSMYRVEKMEVLLPKVSEQKRIVEEVSIIDKSITMNLNVKQNLNNLKQGLMQDLLSGEVRTTDADIEVLGEVLQHAKGPG